MPFDTASLPQLINSFTGWSGGKETNPSKFIPYFDHVKDNVIALKDGRLMAIIKLDPISYYLSNNETRNGNARRHFALLQLLAGRDVEIYEHLVCHDEAVEFKAAPGGSDYWHEFYQRYKSRVLRGLKQYDWYITLIVNPNIGFAGKFNIKTIFSPDAPPVIHERTLRTLAAKVRTVKSALRQQNPRQLGTRQEGGFLFSEMGEAIALMTTCRRMAVPYAQPVGSLGHVIYRERVVHGPLGFLIERGGGRSRATVGRMYGLNVYPKEPRVGMFDKLLSDESGLNGANWVMMNYIHPMSRTQSSERLELLLARLEKSNTRGTSELFAIEDALDELTTSKEVRGVHAWTFAVHANDMEQLDEFGSAAADLIASAGCSPAAAGPASMALYWLQFPGNHKFCPAPASIGLRRFVDLSSLEGHPTSISDTNNKTNKIRWGNHLIRFRNAGGGYYDHEMFDGQLGHTLYCGPSNSGKTSSVGTNITAGTALIGSKGTIIVVDKDGSNKLTVLNNGGTYSELKRGIESGAAPLRRLLNTHQDKNMLFDLIVNMIMSDGGKPLTERAKGRIARGLDFVMRQPPECRQLGTVHAFLPPASLDESDAANRLKPWCAGERTGWAFDGTNDNLDLDQRIVGVDYTQLLEDAIVLRIMSAYLFYLAGKVMDGRRLIFVVEELKFLLPSPEFTKHFEDILLTGRKKNVAFWPVIQQPEHLLAHPLGAALLGQCRTRFLFKNELANRKAYIEGLHCTPQEFGQISEGMTVGAWSALIQRPGKSVLVRFDLSSMPEDIAIVSGTPETVKLWDSLTEQRNKFVASISEA